MSSAQAGTKVRCRQCGRCAPVQPMSGGIGCVKQAKRRGNSTWGGHNLEREVRNWVRPHGPCGPCTGRPHVPRFRSGARFRRIARSPGTWEFRGRCGPGVCHIEARLGASCWQDPCSPTPSKETPYRNDLRGGRSVSGVHQVMGSRRSVWCTGSNPDTNLSQLATDRVALSHVFRRPFENSRGAQPSAPERFQGWGVVCVGHSLGAGVACLLAMLLRGSGRAEFGKARAVVFEPPGGLWAPLGACSALVVACVGRGFDPARSGRLPGTQAAPERSASEPRAKPERNPRDG